MTTSQLLMHPTRQSIDRRNLRNVHLFINDRLMKMSNRPTKRNVEVERIDQLGRGATRVRVTPRPKRSKLLAIGIKRKIAMHHRRNTQRTVGRGNNTVAFLHLRNQRRIGITQAFFDGGKTV